MQINKVNLPQDADPFLPYYGVMFDQGVDSDDITPLKDFTPAQIMDLWDNTDLTDYLD